MTNKQIHKSGLSTLKRKQYDKSFTFERTVFIKLHNKILYHICGKFVCTIPSFFTNNCFLSHYPVEIQTSSSYGFEFLQVHTFWIQ